MSEEGVSGSLESALKSELEYELQKLLSASDSTVDESGSNQFTSESCGLCNYSSVFIAHLAEHYEKVHKLLYCVVCNMRCSSKFHLNTHINANHQGLFAKGKEPLANSLPELRAKMGYRVSSGPKACFVCNYCDKTVQKRSHMKTHVLIHTGEQPFKCNDCDFQTAYKQTIIRHRDMYHLNIIPPQPFSCVHCGKTFRSESQLLLHKPIHNDRKSFPCTKCSYTTYREANLREHMLDKHSNFSEELLKPHECEVCGLRFKSSSHLIRHLKVHNKDVIKSYRLKCEYCDVSFAEKYNLKVHIENIHLRKPPQHICGVCNKGFYSKGDLQAHSIIHQTDPVVHQCSECDFTSKHNKSVIRHFKAKHEDISNIKIFKCPVCGKDFESRAKLNRHSYVHKDKSNRPVKCPKCDYKCIEKSELKRHLKVVHGSPTTEAIDTVK